VDAVARLAFDADDQSQEPALGAVLPEILGDVAERRVQAGRQPPDEQGRAGRRTVGVRTAGPIRGVRRRLGRIRFHRQGSPVGTEGEGLDPVERRHVARGQVQQPELVLDGFFLVFQLLRVRFGQADGERQPLRIARIRRPGTKGEGLLRFVGNLDDTEFVVPVRTVKAVDKPPPVRRESAVGAGCGDRFPLAVIGEGRRRLGGRRAEPEARKKGEDDESGRNGAFHRASPCP